MASVEETISQAREVDPFSFFASHASAVAGFGGSETSPDARYFFHTPYLVVSPGRARFHLHLTGASATKGEVTVRAHAFRPGADAEVGMAAASKLYLAELDGDTVDHVVRFTALEGLEYALFAFFTEPTDLTIATIRITIEEMGGKVPVPANRGGDMPSRVAQSSYPTSHRLVASFGASPALPLSQPIMAGPLDLPAAGATTELAQLEPNPLRQAEIVAALRALDLSGADARGARGLIIDPPSRALEAELARYEVDVDRLVLSAASAGDIDIGFYGADRDGAFDFVVSYAIAAAGPTPDERLQVVGGGLRCLRGSGVAVFLMPFWTGSAHEAKPAAAAECLDRNAVQQIALRLIGQSYSVSQLAFPPPAKRGGEIGSFILIAHKLA